MTLSQTPESMANETFFQPTLLVHGAMESEAIISNAILRCSLMMWSTSSSSLTTIAFFFLRPSTEWTTLFFLMLRFFSTTRSFKSTEYVMFAWGVLQLSQLWRLTSSFDDSGGERIICTICPCGDWPMLRFSAPSSSLLSNSKLKRSFENSLCTLIFLISFSRLLTCLSKPICCHSRSLFCS